MTLQVHPIALGCMLVVAVGTLIYTYVTTRQQAQEHSYGGSNRSRHNIFEEPASLATSRTSSKSSLTEGNGPLPRRKRNHELCTICLTPLKSHVKALTCQHIFHSDCIEMWLNEKTNCPICRQEAQH